MNGLKEQIYDSDDRIIDSFRFHPSIKNIKGNYKITSKFSFKPVSKEFVNGTVNDLYSNKAVGGEIPPKILKECDFFFHFLTNCISKTVKKTTSFQALSNYLTLCLSIRKKIQATKQIIDWLVYYPSYQKPLKK